MTNLPKSVNFKIPSDSDYRVFQTVEDVERWIASEEQFWQSTKDCQMNSNLKKLWQDQRHFYEVARSLLSTIESSLASSDSKAAEDATNRLHNHLASASNGNLVTSTNKYFPAIVALTEKDPGLAAIGIAAARHDADARFGGLGNPALPVSHILRAILECVDLERSDAWITPSRERLGSLISENERLIGELRSQLAQHGQNVESRYATADGELNSRREDWDESKKQFQSEWVDLKRVYDEKLALLAPTQYWSDRAKAHRNLAVGFAVAFGLAIVAAVGVFFWLGAPHLSSLSTQSGVSPVLALIPIAVPAFAGIWTLRMLSRFLSENVQMMRDARERETMVKTFLALMRDDQAGKALVKDDDRILILHSLFRPSAIASIDDAPPVHWFDILSSKTASKSKAG